MALMVLMQFFINASGCKGRITPEMSKYMDHIVLIQKMTEEFEEVSIVIIIGKYPPRMFYYILYLRFNLCFVGKRRVSIDNAWPTVEKVQIELLRFCTNIGETMPVFHNLRSIFDGSLDFTFDRFIGFASAGFPAHSHAGRNETDDRIGRCGPSGVGEL